MIEYLVISYAGLNADQVVQVAHDYSDYTDPRRYMYEVDQETGVVCGRVAITEVTA